MGGLVLPPDESHSERARQEVVTQRFRCRRSVSAVGWLWSALRDTADAIRAFSRTFSPAAVVFLPIVKRFGAGYPAAFLFWKANFIFAASIDGALPLLELGPALTKPRWTCEGSMRYFAPFVAWFAFFPTLRHAGLL